MSLDSVADRAWRTFLSTAWRPDFDGSAADDAAGEGRGNTHWGVVRATWAAEVARGCPVLDQDFDTASQNDFGMVLRWACWRPLWCNQIALGGAPGAAIVLGNMAMVAGAREAVLLLQRMLGSVDSDGVMGPITCAAVIFAMQGRPDLIGDLTRADEAFFASLPTAPEFLAGWTRRAEVFAAVARGFS
ncbi:MAG: hypothetical protein KGL35_15300 [Bradyrhizobium sp.]|nr:hypothetical protein [Bradyrhizobium sp.]